MEFEELENNVQKYMDGRGYNFAELSRLSRVSDKSIRKMIKRQKTARRTKVKLAAFFQVSPLELFPNDPELL